MDLDLTPAQEAEAQRLYELIQGAFLTEARHLARLMASKHDRQLLGQNEFDLRDAVHRLAAAALQTALNERKKGATAGRA
jgi:hypothetical protein